MKYALMISAALLVTSGHFQTVSAQSPTDLVKQSVEALGGADALRAVKTMVSKVDAKHWEPGQSNSVNGESRFLGDSTETISVDFAASGGAVARYDWDRDMQYPAVERLKYSEIRYPTWGAAIDDKGQATPMSGIRIAANLRESLRGSPVLLLRALDAGTGERGGVRDHSQRGHPGLATMLRAEQRQHRVRDVAFQHLRSPHFPFSEEPVQQIEVALATVDRDHTHRSYSRARRIIKGE